MPEYLIIPSILKHFVVRCSRSVWNLAYLRTPPTFIAITRYILRKQRNRSNIYYAAAHRRSGLIGTRLLPMIVNAVLFFYVDLSLIHI